MIETIEKYGHKIIFGTGTNSHNPDYRGIRLSEIKLWVKLDGTEWFKPYGNFGILQIGKMIDICQNEYQLVCLMELLSARPHELSL